MPAAAADERWMARALRLASLSLGMTWPNPGVGCVLVRDGALLGQGRHERCGEVHAEVAALADCRRRGLDPRGATAYVTLAPCTRQGRQPPCVAALAAAGVAAVVAAVDDPSQGAVGAALAAHGIAYRAGCLGAPGAHLHGGFLTRLAHGRPRITGKWAMTIDGGIACADGDSHWISGPEALAASRRRRRAFDAILVGAATARRDDPRLLAPRPRRHGADPGPLRVVVSAGVELDPGSFLARSAREVPLLVVCAPRAALGERLRAAGAALCPVEDPHDPRQVAAALGAHGLNDLLVEGGGTVHGAWLRAGLYDRAEIYIGMRSLGGGAAVASGAGVARVADGAAWEHERPPRLLGGDCCLRLRRRDAPPTPAG